MMFSNIPKYLTQNKTQLRPLTKNIQKHYKTPKLNQMKSY